MTETKRETTGLWLRWIAAGATGGFVFAVAARRVSMAAGASVWESMGAVAAEIVIGALVLGGIMAGIAAGQWVVVRRRVPWAPWLATATAGGGAAGGGAGFGVLQGMGGVAGGGVAVTAAVVAGLAAFGGVQRVFLRGRVPEAGRLVRASIVAVTAAVLATGLSGIALGAYSGGGVGGAVFGAAYAAVTGFVVIPHAVRAPPSVNSPLHNVKHS